MPPFRSPVFLALSALLLISPVIAMSNADVTDHCDKTHYSPEELDCSSTASNDYYGFGVRIGVYCTWISSWVANLFVPSEIAGALDANAIFLLALMISMFHGSATHTLAYIDGLILMQLCAGYLFGCCKHIELFYFLSETLAYALH